MALSTILARSSNATQGMCGIRMLLDEPKCLGCLVGVLSNHLNELVSIHVAIVIFVQSEH